MKKRKVKISMLHKHFLLPICANDYILISILTNIFLKKNNFILHNITGFFTISLLYNSQNGQFTDRSDLKLQSKINQNENQRKM